MPKHADKHEPMGHGSEAEMYYRLAAMAALSFLAMFALMYAMVDRFANVYGNLNQAYMAALMTAPMVILELLIMSSMYPKRSWNVAVLAASAIVLVSAWFLIRAQGGVTDRQFLRSMIPHHAGAVLMCQETDLHDPELERLCQSIVTSQEEEIAFMRAKLRSGSHAR